VLVSGKETKRKVSDDFKASLLSDNPLLKLPFKLLEDHFSHRKASWIWALPLTIVIRFLLNIVDHILV
jgi:hypothetical protein